MKGHRERLRAHVLTSKTCRRQASAESKLGSNFLVTYGSMRFVLPKSHVPQRKSGCDAVLRRARGAYSQLSPEAPNAYCSDVFF
eukprot:scaffold1702_cov391-Prasinococcus_capsulatus_cf.AAC.2